MKQIIKKIKRYCLLVLGLTGCTAGVGYSTEKPLLLSSPSSTLTLSIFRDGDKGFFYTLSSPAQTLIYPSKLGLTIAGKPLLDPAAPLKLMGSNTIKESISLLRYNHQPRNTSYKKYQVSIGHSLVEFAVFDQGCAIRYQLPSGQVHISAEQTSFVPDGNARVWFFERKNSWKLKSYAGLWTETRLDSLDKISPAGPVQGKPLVVQLADQSYLFLTEAGLQGYSGMRLKAHKNSLTADFTEGDHGFEVQSEGASFTPWRVIGWAKDLNALVNQTIVEALNAKPDSSLFKDTGYIKAGKSAWSWITRDENYLDPAAEKKIIDAAAALNYDYTLIDDGWEDKWKQKWKVLKDLVNYGRNKKIKIWVWKDSKFLRDAGYRDAFLDTLSRLGVAGIKIDFMNSEAKALIDFETGFLKAAAKKKLMVNFHGCQTTTGEYRTYPNEMTREGIRGMELNIMNEPIPAWHNAALPFTRFVMGHADYTPALFSNRASTTLSHQLALLYLFDSPFQCIAENPVTLLKDTLYRPILSLIRDLPTTWDRTVVLDGSEIGRCAIVAKKKGQDWYVAAINGLAVANTISLDLSFLKNLENYSATMITDAGSAFSSSTEVPHRLNKKKITLLPGGGLVVHLKPINK